VVFASLSGHADRQSVVSYRYSRHAQAQVQFKPNWRGEISDNYLQI
jgi:hypothetical protein